MISNLEVLSYAVVFVLWFLVGLSSYYYLKNFAFKSSTRLTMTTLQETNVNQIDVKQEFHWFSLFLRNCKNEISDPIHGQITGTIPSWLEGSLIRNGPGLNEIGPDKYKHTFDGLALLRRFCIKNGNATYQHSFLRSNAYLRNTKANRIVVGEFGTVAVPDPCLTIFQRFMSFFKPDVFDNDCVNLVKIADEYYAATESNIIHKIDPETLETKDRMNISNFLSVNMATAHAHYETDGTCVNMGSSFGLASTKYCLIKFPPKTAGKSSFETAKILCHIPSTRALSPSYYHSFAMTENYYIFIEMSLVMFVPKVASSIIRKSAFADWLVWCPDEMVRFHIIKKESGEILPLQLVAKPFFMFHTINSYEEDDKIVLDMCCYEDDWIIKSLYLSEIEGAHVHPRTKEQGEYITSQTQRYILPLNVDKFSESKKMNFEGSKAFAELRDDKSVLCVPEELTKGFAFVEMPRINYEKYNGKKYEYFYAICREQGKNGLIKANVKTGKHVTWTREKVIPSEPVFVPSPNATSEDDGVVLSSLLHVDDDTKVTLLINDGKSFQEIARIEFATGCTISNDFHGVFVS